jgi:Fe-S cluster biosynthesis and repair protein YggX
VKPERIADLPDWPRLMGADMAAAYVSLSATTLREKGPAPKQLGKRRLYDRIDLDRWADRIGGQPLTVPEQRAEALDVERRFLEKRRARG